jgi:hypothetical protein
VDISDGLQAGPPETQPEETPEAAEARARNEVILAPLREEWGGEFDTRYAMAGAEARALFTAEDGSIQGQLFEDLGTRIRANYGPKGDTLALKFLADLAKIKKGG